MSNECFMKQYLHLKVQQKSQLILNMILLVMKCEFRFDFISLNDWIEATKFTSKPTKGSQTRMILLEAVSSLKVAFMHVSNYTKWGSEAP